MRELQHLQGIRTSSTKSRASNLYHCTNRYIHQSHRDVVNFLTQANLGPKTTKSNKRWTIRETLTPSLKYPQLLWGVVKSFQIYEGLEHAAPADTGISTIILLSPFSSPPASSRRTENLPPADNLLATTHPAEPAPTKNRFEYCSNVTSCYGGTSCLYKPTNSQLNETRLKFL